MKITSLTKHGVIYAYNKGCRCEECDGLGAVYEIADNYPYHMQREIPDTWRKEAKCRGMDPNIFIDPANESDAKQACNQCAVQEVCLSYSIRTKNLAGVYGGVNEVNRERAYRVYMRRSRETRNGVPQQVT